jgi:hypothetical protein
MEIPHASSLLRSALSPHAAGGESSSGPSQQLLGSHAWHSHIRVWLMLAPGLGGG